MARQQKEPTHRLTISVPKSLLHDIKAWRDEVSADRPIPMSMALAFCEVASEGLKHIGRPKRKPR